MEEDSDSWTSDEGVFNFEESSESWTSEDEGDGEQFASFDRHNFFEEIEKEIARSLAQANTLPELNEKLNLCVCESALRRKRLAKQKATSGSMKPTFPRSSVGKKEFTGNGEGTLEANVHREHKIEPVNEIEVDRETRVDVKGADSGLEGTRANKPSREEEPSERSRRQPEHKQDEAGRRGAKAEPRAVASQVSEAKGELQVSHGTRVSLEPQVQSEASTTLSTVSEKSTGRIGRLFFRFRWPFGKQTPGNKSSPGKNRKARNRAAKSAPSHSYSHFGLVQAILDPKFSEEDPARRGERRRKAWCAITGASQLARLNPQVMEELLTKELGPREERAIRKDLYRTYPEESLFMSHSTEHKAPVARRYMPRDRPVESGTADESGAGSEEGSIDAKNQLVPQDQRSHDVPVGVTRLRNVLWAYAAFQPKIGYCQGLNFVTGILLLGGMDQYEAFWALLYLMKTKKMRRIFKPGMRGLTRLISLFSDILEALIPELHAHFVENMVPTSLFATKWFISLYSYSMPVSLVLKVWDIFFERGWFAIFAVGLAILETFKCKLMTQGMEHVLFALDAIKGDILGSEDLLLNHTISFMDRLNKMDTPGVKAIRKEWG